MTRRRYEVGDVVELHPDPTHEYPHPDDLDAHTPVVVIVAVITHPENDAWVRRYTVDDDGHTYDVLPGTIARPHTR